MTTRQRKRIIMFSTILVILIITVLGGLYFVGKKTEKQEAKVPTLKPILKEDISTEPSDNPLKREHEWGDSKQQVIEREEVSYAEYLNDQTNYITYNYAELFGEEVLLTYLFEDEKLIAIAYERVLNDLDRKRLNLDHQVFTAGITSMLDKNFAEELEWSSYYEKIYDNNLWSEAITLGEMDMGSTWDNGGLDDIYLFSSAFPLFDFLFIETEDFGLGNQSILVADSNYIAEKGLEAIFQIKPKLTREQVKIRSEGELDLFENSVNEDALKSGVAKALATDTLKIVQFDKVQEAILLVNTTGELIDLTDFTIKTQGGKFYAFEDGFKIKGSERISIYGKDGEDRFTDGVSRVLEWSKEELFDDKRETVTLYDSDGKIVASSK